MTAPADPKTQDRRSLGASPGPMEDALEESFDRQVEEGSQRLSRTWREVLATGFLGATEVAAGVLALLFVVDKTHNELLGGLAFSIGFIALLLGRAELFTEGFLVPVVTVAAKRASLGQLAKLWSGTLVANLVGGWLMMWLLVVAYPSLHKTMVEVASVYANAPFSAETVALSVVGGATITLMTRMQHGTDDAMAKVVAAVIGAFLLAGTGMFHSILNSLLIFAASHTGDASYGYVEWAKFFGVVVIGNMVGGIGLVTLLRVIRSKDRLLDERHARRA